MKPQLQKFPSEPPAYVKKLNFTKDMTLYPKKMTSPLIYQQAFHEVHERYNNTGWSLIYTDGSKNSFSTSFAVVNDIGETIEIGILVDHRCIFTAEALAIKTTIDHAKTFKGKYIICFNSSRKSSEPKPITDANSLSLH